MKLNLLLKTMKSRTGGVFFTKKQKSKTSRNKNGEKVMVNEKV